MEIISAHRIGSNRKMSSFFICVSYYRDAMFSLFSRLPPPWSDPLFSIAAEARAAGSAAIDGTIGIVLTEESKPHVLPVVRAVMKEIATELPSATFAYSPLLGVPEYRVTVESLLGGGSMASIATTGGTAALAINLRVIKAMYEKEKLLLILPVPTWVNHQNVCRSAGLEITEVPYLKNGKVSIDAMLTAVTTSKHPVALVLHAGCHNPTGLDLSLDQWKELARGLANRPCAVLLDLAYQGFKGEPEADAEPIRIMTEAGVPTLVAWSASKNHSIYGLRTGLAAAFVSSADEKAKVEGLYAQTARGFTSTAPLIGQQVVLRTQTKHADAWRKDLRELRSLIDGKRESLSTKLPPQFHTALDGSGMFAVLPLTSDQIRILKEKHKVFLAPDGRINISGIPEKRIGELAEKIGTVL